MSKDDVKISGEYLMGNTGNTNLTPIEQSNCWLIIDRVLMVNIAVITLNSLLSITSCWYQLKMSVSICTIMIENYYWTWMCPTVRREHAFLAWSICWGPVRTSRWSRSSISRTWLEAAAYAKLISAIGRCPDCGRWCCQQIRPPVAAYDVCPRAYASGAADWNPARRQNWPDRAGTPQCCHHRQPSTVSLPVRTATVVPIFNW